MISKEIIKGIGLTDNESEIYLILLKLGEATVYEIAEHSKISRPNVYDIVKKLLEKGLATSITKVKKKYIKSASPEKLLAIIKDKEKDLLEILPNLIKSYEAKKVKPIVEVFTGKEGLKTIMNDHIKVGKDIWIFGGADVHYMKTQISEVYFKRMLKEKKKAGIKTKIMYAPNVKPIKGPGYKLKQLAKTNLGCMSYWVYGDRVAIGIWSETPILIRIISQDVSKTFKESMKLLWISIKD